MAYVPNPEWKDGLGPDGQPFTKITAAKLNNLDGGVEAAARVADSALAKTAELGALIPVVASGDDSNLAAALASAPGSSQVVFVMVAGT